MSGTEPPAVTRLRDTAAAFALQLEHLFPGRVQAYLARDMEYVHLVATELHRLGLVRHPPKLVDVSRQSSTSPLLRDYCVAQGLDDAPHVLADSGFAGTLIRRIGAALPAADVRGALLCSIGAGCFESRYATSYLLDGPSGSYAGLRRSVEQRLERLPHGSGKVEAYVRAGARVTTRLRPADPTKAAAAAELRERLLASCATPAFERFAERDVALWRSVLAVARAAVDRPVRVELSRQALLKLHADRAGPVTADFVRRLRRYCPLGLEFAAGADDPATRTVVADGPAWRELGVAVSTDPEPAEGTRTVRLAVGGDDEQGWQKALIRCLDEVEPPARHYPGGTWSLIRDAVGPNRHALGFAQDLLSDVTAADADICLHLGAVEALWTEMALGEPGRRGDDR